MKPWLLLPAQLAHDAAPIGLKILSAFRESQAYQWLPLDWQGLRFENRLGLAGGVDKNAEQIEDWWGFGPGFIEVGTVTPVAQEPNPGPILFRNVEHLALCNRMGFPNLGVESVRQNLLDLPHTRTTPIFVNIGRNRTTSTELAVRDYLLCMQEIGSLADAFVINISSPNTSGLRDLFEEQNLRPFLLQLAEKRSQLGKQVRLLLKLSPDLTDEEMSRTVLTADTVGFDGFIATNTTIERKPGLGFPNEGGVSGGPLKEKSAHCLRQVLEALGPRRRKGKLIVSTGGIMTPADVRQRLALGADLVQIYTALVFEGPWFFSRVAKAMAQTQVGV